MSASSSSQTLHIKWFPQLCKDQNATVFQKQTQMRAWRISPRTFSSCSNVMPPETRCQKKCHSSGFKVHYSWLFFEYQPNRSYDDDDDVPTISAGFALVVTTHKVMCVCVWLQGESSCVGGGGGAGWLRFDSKRRTREERELVTEKGGGAGNRQ